MYMPLPTRIEKAHASEQDLISNPEHCSLPQSILSQLGCNLGDQVRVTLAGVGALFTVSQIHGDSPNLRLGKTARDKLLALDKFDKPALITWPPAHPFFSDAEASQAPGGEFVERVSDNGSATGLLALAPHGGVVEAPTDAQAIRVGQRLALHAAGASWWACKGWRAGGGGGRAWHVTATELATTSFPLLRTLQGRPWKHVVAFHGYDGGGILLGGRAPIGVKSAVRDALRIVFPEVQIDIAFGSDAVGGSNPRNLVNRLSASGEGLQIEQSLSVRTKHALAIADVVSNVFAERM